jgi:outer membrane receptor protein involved in Fe transport
VLPGFGTTSFSTNPNNLDPYDYYNNPASPGYGGAAAVAASNGLFFRDALIGRPSTEVVGAHVNERGTADYLALRNLDLRSAADTSYSTTKFQQATLNVQQEINDNTAFLVEFNRADSQGIYVYDERARGEMPMISYGFDVADPNNWQLVKGFSVLRHFERETDNEYAGGHLNFVWQPLDALGVEFGWTRRDYEFTTSEARRAGGNAETLNPSLQELGVSAADLGKVYDFGTGLDVPAGTPRQFFAPNIDAFRRVIGFDCNCVNKWGDWRISYFNTPGNQFGVDESDNSYFVQLNWNVDVFNRQLFGNIGVRYAETQVESAGLTTNVAATGPRPLKGENEYSDTLPAFNVAYRITPDVYLRAAAAKVMARPLLSNLAPSITDLTTPSLPGAVGSLTIGNPKVSPFRATNYDFSVEWYFAPGGLLFQLSADRFERRPDSRHSLAGCVRGFPANADAGTATVADQRQCRRTGHLQHPSIPERTGRQDQRLRAELSAGPHVPAVVLPEFRRPGQLHQAVLGAELHSRPGRARLATASHAHRPVPRRVTKVGELHAVLRSAGSVERARLAGLSQRLRDDLSDRRRLVRSGRLQHAADE